VPTHNFILNDSLACIDTNKMHMVMYVGFLPTYLSGEVQFVTTLIRVITPNKMVM